MGLDYYADRAEKVNGCDESDEPLDMTVIRLLAIIEAMEAENTRLHNVVKMQENAITKLQEFIYAQCDHVIPPACEGIGWSEGGW